MEKFFKVILNDEEQAFKASQEIANLSGARRNQGQRTFYYYT